MNTIVTSREAILEVSRNLIREEGWKAVNIRSVAAACNVSVGSIYNYFDSKSELVEATIESVWRDIFRIPGQGERFDSFLDCIKWVYRCMEKGGKDYPGFFTLHSMSFLGEEKPRGRQRMEQSWTHIRDRLCTVLRNDRKVRRDAFDECFTPEKFAGLVLSMIISAVLQQDYDGSTVLEVIRRSIYQ